MSVIRPKDVTDRPAFEHRVDPLSEVVGSMRIQDAIYTRLEATAPWGFHYPENRAPRIRFGLMVRGSALLKFKNQRQAIPLSAGDVFISILSDEPFTLVDHPRSHVADYRELRKLEVDCVIHYGGGGAPTTLVSGSFRMSAFEAHSFPRFCLIICTCGLTKIEVTLSNPCWIFWQQKRLSPV